MNAYVIATPRAPVPEVFFAQIIYEISFGWRSKLAGTCPDDELVSRGNRKSVRCLGADSGEVFQEKIHRVSAVMDRKPKATIGDRNVAGRFDGQGGRG